MVAVPGAELELRAGYERGRFEEGAVRRLLGHLQTLLEAMPTAGERPLHELPLLGEGERRQVLVEWNQTAAAYPQGVCVHELFEQQVARSPEAVAVVCGEQQWTYAELNARANRLAHHLRSLGVGPEVRVGICVERSLAMVAGLLGILKAGGAYVPLDPDYPPAAAGVHAAGRAGAGAADADARCGTGCRSTRPRWCCWTGRKKPGGRAPSTTRTSGVGPGEPGLRHLHLRLHRQAQGRHSGAPQRRQFPDLGLRSVHSRGIGNVLLAATSICFDLSVFELLMPLCRGRSASCLCPTCCTCPNALQAERR